MRFFALCLMCATAAMAASLTSCTRNGAKWPAAIRNAPWDESETDKYPDHNLCTSWDRPYCLIMNEQAHKFNQANHTTHLYGCAECASDCDCKIGQYCQNQYSETEDFGTCVSYTKQLGKTCVDRDNLDKNEGNPTSSEVKKYWKHGDKMACGVYTFYTKSFGNWTYPTAHWEGVCIHGKCRECNSYFMAKPWKNFIGYNDETGKRNTMTNIPCTRALTEVPYKHKGRICNKFGYEYTDAAATFAPAAVAVLAALALF